MTRTGKYPVRRRLYNKNRIKTRRTRVNATHEYEKCLEQIICSVVPRSVTLADV